MKMFLFKCLNLIIALMLTFALVDAVTAESVGLNSKEDFKALKLPSPVGISSSERITSSSALKDKVSTGRIGPRSIINKSPVRIQNKLERMNLKSNFQETQGLSNNGIISSSSTAELKLEQPKTENAIKPRVEAIPKLSVPESKIETKSVMLDVPRSSAVSAIRPEKIDFKK